MERRGPPLAVYANGTILVIVIYQGAPTVPTRNVVLSDHQHELVEKLVRSGRYQNASEVLREGLRMVELREQQEAARLQVLKDAAARGWSDIDAGRYQEVADDRLDDYLDQLGHTAARERTRD
ncbi:type II toxin-antitoxin system ParD family antitoxin [Alloalcanivorax gelatiniphagus]